METPPVAEKKSFNSIKKASLTPCRRIGLGRPSSGSLKKTPMVRTLSSPVENPKKILLHPENKSNEVSEKTFTSISEDRLTSPLKDSNILQEKKLFRSRRCLSVCSSPITSKSSDVVVKNKDNASLCDVSKKRKRSENKCVTLTNIQSAHSSDCIISDSLSDSLNNDKPTTEMIEKIALSIRDKRKKLDQLNVQEKYAKKHNLVELRQQTENWKRAGQEALCYSLELAKQAGYSITLKKLMSQHGFLPHLIGYNSDDDEFD